jgi:hypothetical protein
MFGLFPLLVGFADSLRRWREHWRWGERRLWFWRFLLWYWPHLHLNQGVWLDHCLPDLRKDNLSIRTDQVVVTFVYVMADNIYVKESLLDQ